MESKPTPGPKDAGMEPWRAEPMTPAAEIVSDFVDWLYEYGPDPASMPRGKLILLYAKYRERLAGANITQFPTTEAQDERPDSGA